MMKIKKVKRISPFLPQMYHKLTYLLNDDIKIYQSICLKKYFR
jgi:hypothetical protein